MSIKKVLFGAALVSAATFSLASCAEETNTVQFYTSMNKGALEILEPMVKEFNEKQKDGYKIEVVNPQGGYDGVKKAVNAALQGGNQPALAYCYPDHVAEYLPTNKVINMYDLIHGENGFTNEEIADFIPQFYEEGYKAFGLTEADKKIYTLPFSKSTEAMYYNTVVMEQLFGENYEDHLPETWDELWEIGRLLKKTPGYEKWVVLGYDSEANWFITLDEQYGYDYTSSNKDKHYLFNNENNVKMLKDLKKIFDEGLFTTQTKYGSYTSNLFTKMYKEDDKGNVAVENGKKVLNEQGTLFSIGSTGGAKHQASKQFTAGVTKIPQVDPKNPKSISQGPNIVMLKQDDPAKEAVAWNFVKELMDPDFQAKFAKSQGYMPVRLSCTTKNAEFKEWLEAGEDIISKTMSLAIEQRANYFISPAFNGSNTARVEVGNALVQVITGKATPEKALEDAYKAASF